MRILHVNKYLYRRGGAEAYMLDLAAMQHTEGDEVALFGMQHPLNPSLPFEDTFPSYLELDPPPRGVRERAMAAARILYSLEAGRGMTAMLERVRPDVVHAHNIYQHLSPSVLAAAARRGVPVVMTLHDFKLACPSHLFLDHGRVCEACLGGGFHHAALRRCKNDSFAASALLAAEATLHRATGAYDDVARFLCPSRFMQTKMEAAGIDGARLVHLPNFVPAGTSEPSRRPSRRVACVSRLSHEKGVDVLVDAVAFLDDDVGVDIAGDGPDRARLEDRARDLVPPGRITFHGQVPREQAMQLLRSAAVTAVPSRCYENQPMVVLEAFSVGTPVVGSDLGGISELIRDGRDGLVVPPGDPVALAGALQELLDRPAQARLMGSRGRDRARTTFSAARHRRVLADVYADVTAGGRGSSPSPVRTQEVAS